MLSVGCVCVCVSHRGSSKHCIPVRLCLRYALECHGPRAREGGRNTSSHENPAKSSTILWAVCVLVCEGEEEKEAPYVSSHPTLHHKKP